jgi:hypothetical protein
MREDEVPIEVDDLVEDVLAAGTCDLELVLRYEREPGTLSAGQRAEVEAWLASPIHRDALRAMRNLRASGLEPVAPAPRSAPAGRTSPRHASRRGLRRGGWLLAAGAAAGIAALLLSRTDPPAGEQIAKGVEPAPQVPAPAREPVPVPAPSEPAPPPPTAPPPAVVVPPEAPSPSEAPRSGTPEPSPRVSDPEPQPVLLALAMPRYQAPPGDSRDRIDGALRGTRLTAAALVISPDHVGRTSQASPALYWYLPSLPPAGTEVWLSVVDPAAQETLLDVSLPPPAAAGLQRFALGGHVLAAGIDYTWSVSLRPDLEHPSWDQVAFGWIRHEPPGSESAARIAQAEAGSRPALWAELGYFYDAFAELEALARVHPHDRRVREAQAALLRQAHLEPARLGLQD